jgi:hypothetical protein
MLASGSRRTATWSTGILVSAELAIGCDSCNREVACLVLAQRDTTTEQAKFERVATECRAHEFDYGTLDEPQRHQALHLWVGDINGLDDGLLASLK